MVQRSRVFQATIRTVGRSSEIEEMERTVAERLSNECGISPQPETPPVTLATDTQMQLLQGPESTVPTAIHIWQTGKILRTDTYTLSGTPQDVETTLRLLTGHYTREKGYKSILKTR